MLFFPEERGIAHIARSLAVAETLRLRGHHVLIALPGSKSDIAARSPVERVPVGRFVLDDDIGSIERLMRPSFIADLVREEQAIIDRYRPDCAVVDLRLSALVSARSRSLPTFMITSSSGLPGGCQVPNPGLPALLYRCALPFIRVSIARTQRAFVASLSRAAASVGSSFAFDDLVTSVRYIVPEVPGYLPRSAASADVRYSGPILWDGFEGRSLEWLRDLSPDGRTVYVSFGGTGYDGRKLVALSIALAGKGFRVVVSCGTICDVGDFPSRPDLYVADYLPGSEVCRRADVVVCHGGYGTMIQAVLAGRPIVAIPFNVEQLLHAARFQEMGLARCVTDIGAMALMRFRLRDLMDLGRKVSVDAIVDAVAERLERAGGYAGAGEAFACQVRRARGSDMAAGVIEDALASEVSA